MTPLERTYKMTENPPQPMGWNEYEQKLRDAWNNLLDSNPQEVKEAINHPLDKAIQVVEEFCVHSLHENSLMSGESLIPS